MYMSLAEYMPRKYWLFSSAYLERHVNSPGEYSQKSWVGVCGPLHKPLTLLMTKIYDFCYPIYDLAKTLIPYL